MATRPSTLVGVFHDKITAERTIEQLRDAGFTNQQISYSAGTSSGGGFLEVVRHFFTGPDTSSGDVAGDLMHMGVPEEEARYYAHEHDIGHHLVAVTLTERFQDALTLLYQNGAYHYDRKTGSAQPMTFSQSQLDTALPYDMGSEIPDYSAPTNEKARESYYNAPVDYQTQAENAPQATTPDQSRGDQTSTQPGISTQPNVTPPGVMPSTGQGYGMQPPDYSQGRVDQPSTQKPVYGQQGDKAFGTPDYSTQPPGYTSQPGEKMPGIQDASAQQPYPQQRGTTPASSQDISAQQSSYPQQSNMTPDAQRYGAQQPPLPDDASRPAQQPDYSQGIGGQQSSTARQPDYTQQSGMAGGVQGYGTQPDYTPPSGITPSGQGYGAQVPYRQPDDASAQGILPPQPDVSQHPGVSPKGSPNQPGATPRPDASQASPPLPDDNQPFIDPIIAERERWLREQGNQSGNQQ